MELLEGVDESWKLGLLLGDWEHGSPECGEPHGLTPPGSSPAYQVLSSPGNWAVFLHLHDKIEDSVTTTSFQ